MSDLQAKVYHKNSQMQTEDGLNLISKVCPTEGMKILDLGCGTGYLSTILAEMVGMNGKVVGIDPDLSRISLAKHKYSNVTNLYFQDGSAENIPGRDYDMIFSNYVLHWVKDKEKAFKNIFESLKPDGTFALCLETGLSEVSEDLISLLKPEQMQEVKMHLHFQSLKEIEQIACSCGFSIQYSAEMQAMGKFESFDDFLKCVYGGFSGLVDPEKMDAKDLQKLKRRIGDDSLELELCTIASFIFSKK